MVGFSKNNSAGTSSALLTGLGWHCKGVGEYGSVIYISGNSARKHTQVVSYVIMQKLNYVDYEELQSSRW